MVALRAGDVQIDPRNRVGYPASSANRGESQRSEGPLHSSARGDGQFRWSGPAVGRVRGVEAVAVRCKIERATHLLLVFVALEVCLFDETPFRGESENRPFLTGFLSRMYEQGYASQIPMTIGMQVAPYHSVLSAYDAFASIPFPFISCACDPEYEVIWCATQNVLHLNSL